MKLLRNLTVYRIGAGWAPDINAMCDALEVARFAPCGATQDKSSGWVPPRGDEHGAMIESVAGQRILKLQIQTKSVPSAAVRAKALEEAEHIEATTGRKPGKKEMKALKEDALLALLPQAFAKTAEVWVWIDPAAGLLMLDATSQGARDEVVTALVRSFDGLALSLVQTNTTPQAYMSHMLTSEPHLSSDFDVERACELVSGDEEKSVVKFNRHNLITEEVRKHITEGKLPKWAAMSYDGRVSFVLDESMRLKKIALLEGVFDDRTSDADNFDTDIALITGELSRLIASLIDALGGELPTQQPTA